MTQRAKCFNTPNLCTTISCNGQIKIHWKIFGNPIIKKCSVVENDLTKLQESKIRYLRRKLKSKVVDQENKHLYPTGSQPDKFYYTVKLHKFPINGNLNNLPLRPVVSKITTSAYNLKALLSKLLSPLLQPHHNMKTSQDFI